MRSSARGYASSGRIWRRLCHAGLVRFVRYPRVDMSITPQKGNFSYVGFQYYTLTWCCFEGQDLFTQRDHVELVRAQFLRASAETQVVDIVHCYMPDHVHQVVKGDSPDADARVYIRKAKQYSGYYFQHQYKVKLWLRKGFNHVVLDGREYLAAVKYVIENPLRAGLVNRVEDYPFTGSATYTIEELKKIAYGV